MNHVQKSNDFSGTWIETWSFTKPVKKYRAFIWTRFENTICESSPKNIFLEEVETWPFVNLVQKIGRDTHAPSISERSTLVAADFTEYFEVYFLRFSVCFSSLASLFILFHHHIYLHILERVFAKVRLGSQMPTATYHALPDDANDDCIRV